MYIGSEWQPCPFSIYINLLLVNSQNKQLSNYIFTFIEYKKIKQSNEFWWLPLDGLDETFKMYLSFYFEGLRVFFLFVFFKHWGDSSAEINTLPLV